MPSCAVSTCKNSHRTRPGDKTLSYHNFPKNPKLAKLWLQKCKNHKLNSKTPNVCSEHFNKDDFELDFRKELLGWNRPKRLKSDAVPSLRLPGSRSNLTEIVSKRAERAKKRQNAQLVRSLLLESQGQAERVTQIEQVLLTPPSSNKLSKVLPPPTETETDDPFPKFQCINCPEYFDNADALIAHTTSVHPPKSEAKEEEEEVLADAESTAPPVIFNPFCILINKRQCEDPDAQAQLELELKSEY